MVNAGKGRMFRRKDGKYLIYLPLDLATDPMFPIKTYSSMKVRIYFETGGKRLIVEPFAPETDFQEV